MNPATIIILAVIFGLFVFASIRYIKNKRSGKGCCGCSGCTGACTCCKKSAECEKSAGCGKPAGCEKKK